MEPNVVEVEDEIGSPGAEPGRNGLVNRWAPSQFRRNMLGAALLIVIVTLALVLHYYNRVSTDDAQIDGHITPEGFQGLRKRAGGAGGRQPASEGRTGPGAARPA